MSGAIAQRVLRAVVLCWIVLVSGSGCGGHGLSKAKLHEAAIEARERHWRRWLDRRGVGYQSLRVDDYGGCDLVLGTHPYSKLMVVNPEIPQGPFHVVDDLSLLKDMPLRSLSVRTPVLNLTPLQGMPLERLCFWSATQDLSPLRGLPLTRLDADVPLVTDLTPLRGLPLTRLGISCTATDVSALAGMALQFLSLRCPVEDLSPLRGMPLVWLLVESPQVSDLSPLAGVPLKYLEIRSPRHALTDLSPLEGMPLEFLYAPLSEDVTGIDVLRGLKTLREVNGTAAAEFLAERTQEKQF